MLLKAAIGLIAVASLIALGRLLFVLLYGWVALEVEKHRVDSAD